MTLLDPWTAVTTTTKIRIARALYRLAAGVRRARGKYGPIMVRRNGLWFDLDLAEGIDLAIFFLGTFEPATSRALARLAVPGTIALDIGANIGFHTLHLARAVGPGGHVFAFEPTEYAQKKFLRNLQLNPMLMDRVTLVRAYLDGPRANAYAQRESDAPISFYSSWRLDSLANQHPKHFGTMKSAWNSERMCIDDFIESQQLDRVDLVKLDVDGYECRVLGGATCLLEQRSPTFVMELCPYALEEHGASASQMLSTFTSRGYRLYDERMLSPLPMEAAQLVRRIPKNSSINIVASKAW